MNDWNEVAEIIGGEIEKNGKCSAETGWTLAGHLILKLDIPGLKKKSNSKLDVTAAVKVVPELSKFVSKRGRGQGIVLKSSIADPKSDLDDDETVVSPVVDTPKPEPIIAKQFAPRSSPVAKIEEEDPGPSGMPGSLLGNANDPGRPNLLPNFGDWAKKKEEDPTFDRMLVGTEVWEVPRTNRLRGVIQTVHVTNAIRHVFGGEENELGQIKFQDKKFLLSPENLVMFERALFFVFNATHVIGG